MSEAVTENCGSTTVPAVPAGKPKWNWRRYKPSLRFDKTCRSGHQDFKTGKYTLHTETIVDGRNLLFIDWLLLVRHTSACDCSYCKPSKMLRKVEGEYESYMHHSHPNPTAFPKIVFPPCKATNSWRTIYWKKGEDVFYLRWTLPRWFAKVPLLGRRFRRKK